MLNTQPFYNSHLASLEMQSAIWFQNLDGAVCVSFRVNAIFKGMNPSLLLPGIYTLVIPKFLSLAQKEEP